MGKRKQKIIEPIKIRNLKNIPFRFSNQESECKCVNQCCIFHDKRNCKDIQK